MPEQRFHYTPCPDSRFRIAVDKDSQDRFRIVSNTFEALRNNYPFVVAAVLFGSLAKGRELTSEEAPHINIDLAIYIDRDRVAKQHPELIKRDLKYSQGLRNIKDLSVYKAAARPEDKALVTATYFVQDLALRSLIASIPVKDQMTLYYSLHVKPIALAGKHSIADIYEDVFTNYPLAELQTSFSEPFPFTTRPFHASLLWGYDLDNSLLPYRRAYFEELDRHPEDRRELIWKAIMNFVRFYERLNQIPEALSTQFPNTLQDAKRYYGLSNGNQDREQMIESREETTKTDRKEEVFSQVPNTIPGIKEMLRINHGWVGFNTPYSQVLRPLFLEDEGKKEMDLVVVDFGCGWGEHVALAGIGYPNGGVPQVQRAIGLNADATEVERAKVLAKFAQIAPYDFVKVMQNADIGIGIHSASPTVERMQHIITDPTLFYELRAILEGDIQGSTDYSLSLFLHKHLYKSSKPFSMNDLPKAESQGNIEFIDTNIFAPELPDNFADRIISSSVSSYIKDPNNETAMWTSVLRTIKPDGVINAISYEYQRYGKWVSAPDQLAQVAQNLGVVLKKVQKRDGPETNNHTTLRQTVFKVVSKP